MDDLEVPLWIGGRSVSVSPMFPLGNMGPDCRFKTDEQGYPHGLETFILWTREGVTRKVVVSDVITLIVVVM